MKRRTWIMMACIMLAATLSIGGTLAYLTDVDTKVNTFTMGEVDIEVEEEFEDGVELNPGAEVNKDAQITNVGENPAWVWMTVAVPSEAAGYIDLVWNGVTPDYTTENVTGDDGNTYTVYTVLVEDQLASGASTAKLLDGVKMDEFVDYRDGKYIHVEGGVETEIDYDLSNLEVIVSGYAVQTEGFDTISEAYAGYGQQWGNQAIPTEEDEDTEEPEELPTTNWMVDGEPDTSWYNTTDTTFTLDTAAELAGLAKLVNEGNGFGGKTIQLGADIDLGDHLWTPIGQTGTSYGATNYFQGNLDGQGHTITSLYITETNDGEHYAAGLFGFLDCGQTGTIKGFTIDGAVVYGHHWTGAAAGYLSGNMENVTVKNAEIKCTHANDEACGDKAGTVVGYINGTQGKMINCTASDSTVTAGRDAGQVVGSAVSTQVESCTATNVTVTAAGDCTGANIKNEVIGRLN